MRWFILLIVLWLSMDGPSLQAAPTLRFKISRPYCVFNFLETCKGVNGTSQALKQYIETNTKQDPVFRQLIEDYRALQLDIMFTREGFPTNRPSYRSTKDLLIIAAVQADNMATFNQRIIGILHNSEYDQLIQIMAKADRYYQKIIWQPHGQAALNQLKKLTNYQEVANQAFLKLKRFYRSTWPDDLPFTIAFTPVPGKAGSTAATPHANSLCVDILTQETNYVGRVAIILHEICHVLYAEQSPLIQHQLEDQFTRARSPYTSVAHNFFDEGLATACGNGWAYAFVAGKPDSAAWYSDPYIDGFGHALFPLVRQYLQQAKTIDSTFINTAIDLFGKTFPKALHDYGIRLNHLSLYSDEERPLERDQIKQDLYGQFSVYWLNFSTPIQRSESLSSLKASEGTQLILVDRDKEKTFATLRTILSDLSTIPYDLRERFVINYFDSSNRLIIIANIKKGEASSVFKALKEKQFVSVNQPYWQLP